MIRGSPSRPAAFQAARVFSAPSRSMSGVPPPMIQPSAYFAVRSKAAAHAAADDQRRPARPGRSRRRPRSARTRRASRRSRARARGSRRRRPRSRPRARRRRRRAPGGPPDERVDRRRLLGQQRAAAPGRREQDRGGELDPLGHRAGRGQRDQRLVVAVDDPVDRPEAGEAARLGTPGPLQQLLTRGAPDGRGQADSDVHARHPKAVGARARSRRPGAARDARISTALIHGSSSEGS